MYEAPSSQILIVDKNGNGDYLTIQDAIENSTEGTHIRIWAGTYQERCSINKTLQITGNGSGATVINGALGGDVLNIQADGVRVSELEVKNSGSAHLYAGIEIHNSSYCEITNVSLTTCGLGIFINRSSHNNISQCFFYMCVDGAYLLNSVNNTVQNGTFFYSTQSGVRLERSGSNSIMNNVVKVGSLDGIVAEDGSDDNDINNNTCRENDGKGIVLKDCRGVSLVNNTCDENSRGIVIYNCHNNTIESNICRSNDIFGIRIRDGSSSNLFKRNEISHQSFGIRLNGSSGNVFMENNCSFNTRGIHLIESSRHIIEGNILCNNSKYGISLKNCSNNTLTDNLYFFNSLSGLSFQDYSQNNTIQNDTVFSVKGVGFRIDHSSFTQIMNSSCNFLSKYSVGVVINQSQKCKVVDLMCDGSGTGINIVSSKNITCRNNILKDGSISLQYGSDGCVIADNQLMKQTNGIVISYSNNSYIYNNTMNSGGVSLRGLEEKHWTSHTIPTNNTISGRKVRYLLHKNGVQLPANTGQVFAYNCSNIIVSGCNLSNTYEAARVVESKNVKLSDNIIHYARYGIIVTDSSMIELNNNSLYQCITRGIRISFCDKVTTKDNLVRECVFGIRIEHTSNNTIEGNKCYNNSYGLTLDHSPNNIIRYNDMRYNRDSGWWFISGGIIIISHSDNNIIKKNICNNNEEYGIFSNSLYNYVENNTCNSNDDTGIQINSNSGDICWNRCEDNSKYGIYTYSPLNIHNNTIRGNLRGICIDLYGDEPSTVKRNVADNLIEGNEYGLYLIALNNYKIHHNNLINNTDQVYLTHAANNIWDNGVGEGNYWSDYAGADDGSGNRTAGDGIGDTMLPHDGVDDYPFMESWGWYVPEAPTMVDPGDWNSDGIFSVSWSRTSITTGYRLQMDTDPLFDEPFTIYQGPDFFNEIQGYENGTYFFRVRSENEHRHSLWSDFVDIIVDKPPDIPMGLNVSVLPEGGRLALTWDPNPSDTFSYLVYTTTSEGWTQISELFHPVNYSLHDGLEDGATYSYKLQAVDSRGQMSGFSGVVSGVPHDSIAPGAPTGLRVIATTYHSVSLKWDPSPEDDFVRYDVYRSDLAEPASWGEPVNEEVVTYPAFEDGGVNETTTYHYTVTAVDDMPNESPHSDIAIAETLLGPHGPEIVKAPKTIRMDEDTVDSTSVILKDWFSDPNGDPLQYQCVGSDHIRVDIDPEEGIVTIKPDKDWSGRETLTFLAEDGRDGISDDVTIIVNPVNDAPYDPRITSPSEGEIYYQNSTIDLSGTCFDPDIEYGDRLSFTWSSNISGRIGVGSTLHDFMLAEGNHSIIMEVADEAGVKVQSRVNITVQRKVTVQNITPEEPVEKPEDVQNITEDEQPDEIENETEDSQDKNDKPIAPRSNYIIPVSIGFILLIFLLSIYFIRKRHANDQPESEKTNDSEEKGATRKPPDTIKPEQIPIRKPTIANGDESGDIPIPNESEDDWAGVGWNNED